MSDCDRCGKKTEVTFLWQYHLDTTGWCHSGNLCENCYLYFPKLGTEIPLNDITELPKLSGIYNS